MRIGVNLTNSQHGGGGAYTRRLLAEWSDPAILKDDELIIVTSQRTGDDRELLASPRFRISRLSFGTKRSFGRAIAEQVVLPRVLRQQRVDVLFCPINTGPILPLGLPVVVTLHSALPYYIADTTFGYGPLSRLRIRTLQTVMERCARAATGTIVLSQHFHRRFLKHAQVSEARTLALGLGCDRDATARSSARLDIRRRSSTILSVGHLYQYRGHEITLKAFARSRRQFLNPATKLVLIGKSSASEQRRVLALIRDLNLIDAAEYVGDLPHDQVLDRMRTCGLFVFQSLCENWPVTLAEALATGCPTLAARIPGCEELIGNGGLLFDPRSSDQLCEDLVRLERNPALRTDLAILASKRADMLPTWREVAMRTLEFIRRCRNTPFV